MRVNLANRDRQAELMDDPALGAAEHRRALEGLRRVNRFSRSVSVLWPSVREIARTSGNRPLRILDIASGGGDVAIGLARQARRRGLDVTITGCDFSPVAVEYAAAWAEAQTEKNVQFVVADALRDDLDGPYDVVMCSLFLHHLSDGDALNLLRRMKDLAQRAVLVNDLRRTRTGYVLAWAGCRLLTRSPIVHTDGPLSVRAAFTIHEIRQLAEAAGLDQPTIARRWPQRFLLDWRPSC